MDIATIERVGEVTHRTGGRVCDHRDDADGADGQERQEQAVIARIPGQTGLHALAHRACDVAGGVLDGLDVVEFGHTTVGFQLDVQSGTARHIVDDDRLVRGIVDRLVVAEHAFLRRTGVIRGDHEHRVGARLLGLLHHAHGVRGVVGTGAGNDRHVHDFLDGLDQFDLLLHVGGRRFAGGAVDHKTVGTIRHELPRQLLRGFEIYGSVGLHGGDHGRKDTSEGSRIEQMHCTVVSLRACHTANGTSLCGRFRFHETRKVTFWKACRR